MSTSQQTAGLSKPAGATKISAGTLSYLRARHRQRAYDLVIAEFKKSEMTQADLARRLGKPPEIISRLLARPGNWESDTFSDLLFAISGAIASFAVDYPLAEQAPEIAVGTARPQIPPVPAQGGTVFGLFSKRLSEMTSNTASQLNANVFAYDIPGDQKLKRASPSTTENGLRYGSLINHCTAPLRTYRCAVAEPTQFTFNLTEVAELLIKKQGIHEGKWLVGLEFNINIGTMGVAPPNAYPGAMILCNGLQLTKAPDQAPANLVVDAAQVNPAKKT